MNMLHKIATFLLGIYSPLLLAENFNMYRWNESYIDVKSPENGVLNYQDIKHISLSKSDIYPFVSVGGTVRERVNYYDNDLFNLNGDRDGSIFLHRLLGHLDFKFNEDSRLFVELGSHLTSDNGIHPGPFDDDALDITQLFIDVKQAGTLFRVGRQEFTLGSGRLVSIRDGPNIRRAFDGVVLKNASDKSLNIFYLQQVDTRRSGFDNKSNRDETLWGASKTWKSQLTNIDVYYLGLERSDSSYRSISGREDRHTVGARFYQKKANFDWNYELIYQFGEIEHYDIDAWSIASVTGYTFKNTRWSPRLSLSANAASGDTSKSDKKINTFNPLFPNISYFEEAAILSPQNFFNIEPKISLAITEKLAVSIDWDFFWRLEDNDTVYVRGLNPFLETAQSDSHFVAQINSLSIDYEFNKYVSADYSLSYFRAEDVIKEVGGEDILFMKLQLQMTF